MDMKNSWFNKFILKYLIGIFLFFLLHQQASIAQSYSLVPVDLNSHASVGTFFYATMKVVNPSPVPVTMFMRRIVKDMPPNWSSCFCFPTCIAPWMDTLTFTIPAFSEDSIKPNFYQSDSIPGIGTISIELFQIGFESFIDTITFTGTTYNPAGISDVHDSEILYYPNPADNTIFLQLKTKKNYSFLLYDLSGKLCFSGKSNLDKNNMDVSALPSGTYLFSIRSDSGERIMKRIQILH